MKSKPTIFAPKSYEERLQSVMPKKEIGGAEKEGEQ